MKALLLSNEYPPYTYGGAGVHVEYLTKELLKLIDIEVRCFGDQDICRESFKIQGFSHDKSLLNKADKKLAPVFDAIYKNLLFNIEPINASLVHCHTWYTHMAGIFAKKAYNIPLVITTHSLEPLRPWKREQLGHGYDLTVWIEKTALEMADAVIAVSEGMKRDILNLFDIDSNRIKVIYNGIDTNEFKQTFNEEILINYGINPKIPYVLFVGRIARQKGIIHLVNAIKYINPDVQIVLCAGAPDTKEIKLEMEQCVNKAALKRQNIHWIQKMIPRQDLIVLYSHASVFCCPSIYEPFGIINLEALACSVPVVASAVGGIVEIVRHAENGFLVEFEQHKESPFEAVNPEQFSKDLASSINKILDNNSLKDKMGKAGRILASTKFSWENIAAQVVQLYKSIT
ncbi:MAG: glycogen synthase [Nitrospirae bacterium]|nr:glycogen synthase [Nitrospirota bacterium]